MTISNRTDGFDFNEFGFGCIQAVNNSISISISNRHVRFSREVNNNIASMLNL